ncbi:hypothetical protein BRAS3809_870006 [Bradyrhizobium sp. STM 3809]|nr:hypothetical protein BRAS3809_870006 [Bradyrhizobium sp. STM 3809]
MIHGGVGQLQMFCFVTFPRPNTLDHWDGLETWSRMIETASSRSHAVAAAGCYCAAQAGSSRRRVRSWS